MDLEVVQSGDPKDIWLHVPHESMATLESSILIVVVAFSRLWSSDSKMFVRSAVKRIAGGLVTYQN